MSLFKHFGNAAITAFVICIFGIAIATAQSSIPTGSNNLRLDTGGMPWLGCCEHCSSVTCSGCDSISPLELGRCDTDKLANCKTVDDVSNCKPVHPRKD